MEQKDLSVFEEKKYVGCNFDSINIQMIYINSIFLIELNFLIYRNIQKY